MDAISSPYTFVTKWVGPTAWLGFWSVMGVIGVVKMLPEPAIGSAIMLLLGYFACSNINWCLADEVLDFGTYLRVRRGSIWEHIELSRIEKVTGLMGYKFHSARVSLLLRTPCAFGTVIRFVPRVDFWGGLSADREVANDLQQRIKDEHRRKLATYSEQVRQAASGGNGEPGDFHP